MSPSPSTEQKVEVATDYKINLRLLEYSLKVVEKKIMEYLHIQFITILYVYILCLKSVCSGYLSRRTPKNERRLKHQEEEEEEGNDSFLKNLIQVISKWNTASVVLFCFLYVKAFV